MKHTILITLSLLSLTLTGCFRQEVQIVDFSIPDLKTQKEIDFLAPRIKSIHGVANVKADLTTTTLTVTYTNRYARMMNIEEAIALNGFDVNHRPANLTAKQKRTKLLEK